MSSSEDLNYESDDLNYESDDSGSDEERYPNEENNDDVNNEYGTYIKLTFVSIILICIYIFPRLINENVKSDSIFVNVKSRRDLDRTYREFMRRNHPDKVSKPDIDTILKVQNDYTLLKKKFL
tara:strand:- start:4714 stop:5082 length:369 start_codon:yes stop_codon:yes gene_type:complete